MDRDNLLVRRGRSNIVMQYNADENRANSRRAVIKTTFYFYESFKNKLSVAYYVNLSLKLKKSFIHSWRRNV